MLVGGGTGGHILPLLAVADSIHSQQADTKLVVVIDKSTNFSFMLEQSKIISEIHKVSAGKLRRYAGRSTLETMLDFKTILLNIRDLFRTIIGIFQSILLIRRVKPDIIFIKGGFVAVPLGIASKLNRVPFITHDSDATPGLANRIIGRWAKLHLVGMKKENYDYPQDKTIQVGIPTSGDFKKVTPSLKASYRQTINVDKKTKLILVTGGSQGAKSLNQIMAGISRSLISEKSVCVIHQTGTDEDTILPRNTKQYKRVDFLANLHLYSGAADVIVSRAGSVLAEFAAQGKAVIVVPAPHLAGDHQTKNAKLLSRAGAVISLSQAKLKNNPALLEESINNLLEDTNLQNKLAKNLSNFYVDGSAAKTASIIIKEAGKA